MEAEIKGTEKEEMREGAECPLPVPRDVQLVLDVATPWFLLLRGRKN